MNAMEQLREMINNSNNIVFFGGADCLRRVELWTSGVWMDCIIRSMTSPPETILSHTFYRREAGRVLRFYKDKMLCLGRA